MPEEKEPPRPHGDKLMDGVGNRRNNPEDNQAQVQSDAQPDAVGGMGSEDDGELRKRQYKNGADLVSGID